jgi:hypothetical protein
MVAVMPRYESRRTLQNYHRFVAPHAFVVRFADSEGHVDLAARADCISSRSLFESGTFADATVVCRGRTFPIHRAIVCDRSAYLQKALDGPFEVPLSSFFR